MLLATGRWCSWNNDGEPEPLCAIYGTMVAELEVLRTMKRAELWAFVKTFAMFFTAHATIHTDHQGVVQGLKQKDADLWKTLWDSINDIMELQLDVDVKHVKAHRTKKEKEVTTKEQKIH